jgi:hypothetical protein
MVDKVAGNFVGIFVSNRFPSIDIIGQVRCPVLFLHGKADEIIPHTHSERLFAACSSSRFLCIRENMTHNRFILEKDVLEPIANFFDFAGDAMPLWELDPMIFIHPSKRRTSLVLFVYYYCRISRQSGFGSILCADRFSPSRGTLWVHLNAFHLFLSLPRSRSATT